MDKTGKIIAVQGATGRQGGAVARHLLKDGWLVRALTRDPNKEAARTLANLGAEVVRADNDDRASLEAALRGVYGAFAVQNFWLPGVGAEGEVRQGRQIADLARQADVLHFVYSSVGGAERHSGLAHFESKWQIEEYIRSLGLPATILRPVNFMDNIDWSRPAILAGSFPGAALRPDRTLQLIAVDDIGAFAAIAFDNPQEWIGKAVELAGDELTEAQRAEILSRVVGRPVRVIAPQDRPGLDEAAKAEQRRMREWFNDAGYQADIPALREIYPRLHTFEEWLRESGWEHAAASEGKAP